MEVVADPSGPAVDEPKEDGPAGNPAAPAALTSTLPGGGGLCALPPGIRACSALTHLVLGGVAGERQGFCPEDAAWLEEEWALAGGVLMGPMTTPAAPASNPDQVVVGSISSEGRLIDARTRKVPEAHLYRRW